MYPTKYPMSRFIIYLDYLSLNSSINLPSRLSEQLFSINNPGLFGLSAHEVYLATNVTISTVSSYPTFSPLPFGRLFSVALAVFT